MHVPKKILVKLPKQVLVKLHLWIQLVGEHGVEVVRKIREGEELGQSEFAAKLNISVQHLSNVENGRKHVSIERAEAWAKVLGYPEPRSSSSHCRISFSERACRATS